MTGLRDLLRSGHTVLVPGAHDALSARMIEHAGFEAFGVGGSALAATQLALPDIGLQSFGEYRDSVARILSGSSLPALVDGENGFGDVKAVRRTVRAFEDLGVSALALEDLTFPPVLGSPPSVIPEAEMVVKLEAALAARRKPDMFLIGRTDAVGVLGLAGGIQRARLYAEVGVDAVLLTGIADAEALKRVRDEIQIPIFALVVENGPWYVPTPGELSSLGYEFAIYPASLLTAALAGYRNALTAIAPDNTTALEGDVGPELLRALLRTDDWAAVDAAAVKRTH